MEIVCISPNLTKPVTIRYTWTVYNIEADTTAEEAFMTFMSSICIFCSIYIYTIVKLRSSSITVFISIAFMAPAQQFQSQCLSSICQYCQNESRSQCL